MNGLSGASACALRNRVSAVLMSPRSRSAFAWSASSFCRPCAGDAFCVCEACAIGVGLGRTLDGVPSGWCNYFVIFNFSVSSCAAGSDPRMATAVSFCEVE